MNLSKVQPSIPLKCTSPYFNLGDIMRSISAPRNETVPRNAFAEGEEKLKRFLSCSSLAAEARLLQVVRAITAMLETTE